MFRNRGLSIFQPGRRTSTSTAASSCQPFQCQYGFLDLLALKPEFREHFVDVQELCLPFCP
jgi:hypothetical protein